MALLKEGLRVQDGIEQPLELVFVRFGLLELQLKQLLNALRLFVLLLRFQIHDHQYLFHGVELAQLAEVRELPEILMVLQQEVVDEGLFELVLDVFPDENVEIGRVLEEEEDVQLVADILAEPGVLFLESKLVPALQLLPESVAALV